MQGMLANVILVYVKLWANYRGPYLSIVYHLIQKVKSDPYLDLFTVDYKSHICALVDV